MTNGDEIDDAIVKFNLDEFYEIFGKAEIKQKAPRKKIKEKKTKKVFTEPDRYRNI